MIKLTEEERKIVIVGVRDISPGERADTLLCFLKIGIKELTRRKEPTMIEQTFLHNLSRIYEKLKSQTPLDLELFLEEVIKKENPPMQAIGKSAKA